MTPQGQVPVSVVVGVSALYVACEREVGEGELVREGKTGERAGLGAWSSYQGVGR